MTAPRVTRGRRGGQPKPRFPDMPGAFGVQIVGLHELRERVRGIRRLTGSKPVRLIAAQQREIRAIVMQSWRRAWDSGGATLAGRTQGGKAPWAPHDLVDTGALRAAAVGGKPMPKVKKTPDGVVITVRAYSAQWARKWGEYLAIDAAGGHAAAVVFADDVADRIAGLWSGVRGRS